MGPTTTTATTTTTFDRRFWGQFSQRGQFTDWFNSIESVCSHISSKMLDPSTMWEQLRGKQKVTTLTIVFLHPEKQQLVFSAAQTNKRKLAFSRSLSLSLSLSLAVGFFSQTQQQNQQLTVAGQAGGPTTSATITRVVLFCCSRSCCWFEPAKCHYFAIRFVCYSIGGKQQQQQQQQLGTKMMLGKTPKKCTVQDLTPTKSRWNAF